MKVIVAGDCEKHDFILGVATMLKAYTNKTVAIVTDEDRNYRYFGGESSGIRIDVEKQTDDSDITLYDWHYGLPTESLKEADKILLATSFEKRSVESVENILIQLKGDTADALLVIESDCGIDHKYLDKTLPVALPMYRYLDEPRRRIDWVYDGRVNLKVDKEFGTAVESFLTEFFEIPSKDFKKLWSFARKEVRK